MAFTQIADVIVPEVYGTYDAVNSPEKTALFESGIIVSNALLNQKANTGGKTIHLPFWNDLDSSAEPNLSDDTTGTATPLKNTTGEQIARIAYLNQWWSAADLAGEIAGSSPMQHTRNRTGTYWTRQWQRRLIASSNGILADNVDADSSDMVNDIASESIAAQTAATKWSRGAFTAAVFTLGDSFGDIGAIGVHSAVYKQMVDANDIDFIKSSDGTMDIPTFMNKVVIVDDNMTVTAGSTNGFKYTTVLFGAGAFGYGEGSPTVPVEIDRTAKAGNGGGVESLGERKTWILHPKGFKDIGTPSGESYSLAELADKDTWDRVVERKNVPLAFLITN